MEQEIKNLLELIERPAFLVRNGLICECNQQAYNRGVEEGIPVSQIIASDPQAYENYRSGILYLTVDLGWGRCDATVTQQDNGDLFLLDRDADHAELQALALAAQQLRIPLSNIMSAGDQLFSQLEEDKQQEKAAQMRRGMFQLMRLIGNMADAGRYAGMETAKPEITELGSFFREVFEKAATVLESTGIEVLYTQPDSQIFTVIDRERMERAVMNLLSNAVKFSNSGSSIVAKLTHNGRMASLSIEDHGDGISVQAHGNLFRRYLREPALEDSRFGLGLGLTLVRSVAAAHGGTVLVDNPNGTRVTITMRISKEKSATLRSPNIWVGDYAGGQDKALLEFSDCLPWDAYKTK